MRCLANLQLYWYFHGSCSGACSVPFPTPTLLKMVRFHYFISCMASVRPKRLAGASPKARGGGKETDGWMHRLPLYSTGHRPISVRCPKKKERKNPGRAKVSGTLALQSSGSICSFFLSQATSNFSWAKLSLT